MNIKDTIKELSKKYNMKEHIEGGLWSPCPINNNNENSSNNNDTKRNNSGAIYYYLRPNEFSKFHILDCDEYWIHNIGDNIKIYSFRKNFKSEQILGNHTNNESCIYIPKNTYFAAKAFDEENSGAFITCITVPRFMYGEKHYKVYETQELCENNPFFPSEWQNLNY